MLEASLNRDIPVKICNEWSDLTLRQGVKLYAIADRFPDAVKELYSCYLETQTDAIVAKRTELENRITDEQRIKVLPKLYGEVMELLTDIDAAIIKQLLPDQRTAFYQKYLAKFVIGVLHFPIDLNVQNITSFELEGTRYELPTTRKFNIGLQEIVEPFANTSIIEFTEAADLQLAAKQLEGGKIAVLSNICGILCRPEGEAYNENVSLQRAAYFMDKLTMDIAWEVFFCLVGVFSTLKQRSQIFSNLHAIKKEMTASLNSSVGTLKSLASQKTQRRSSK